MSEHSLSDTERSSSIEPEVSPADFGDGGTGDNPQPDDPQPDNPQPVNPQPGNPQPGNPQPGNPQPGNPQPGNPQPGNPQPGNPQPGNLQPGNPQPGNPQPGNPQPGNPQPGNPQPGNPQPAISEPVIPRSLLDFSEEFLLIIFRFVLDGATPFETTGPCCAPPTYRPNPVDIWSCYKTCQKFRRVAKEFLFTHVRVRHLASSIERLERISQNPVFCRNTRVVHIDLGLHNEANKSSFFDFVRTQIQRLRDCVATPFPPSETEADRAQANTARNLVLESWRQVRGHLRAHRVMHQDDPAFEPQRLLFRMWHRYREVIQEQEILLSTYRDGISFADRVAAAMARMPALKEIRFEDSNPSRHRFAPMGVDREGNLDENWLMNGGADYYPYGVPGREGRFNLLAEVPIAAHRANVGFDKIDMRFFEEVDLTMFARNSPTRAALALAFGQVRNFLLVTEDWDGGDDDNMIPEILGLLGTPVLERLRIDFGRTEVYLSHLQEAASVSEDQDRGQDEGQSQGQDAYSNLRSLFIYGKIVPDPCPDLEALLEWLPHDVEVEVEEHCQMSPGYN